MEPRPKTTVDHRLTTFGTRPFRHRLGLKTGEWFGRDEAFAFDLARKRQRLATERARVELALAGSGRASRTVAEAVAGVDSLTEAGLGVQADLVVLERDEDVWRFTAGLVCFPTAWEPPDKLGLPMIEIHDPVPGYAEQIGQAVNGYLDRLEPGKVQWRRNWTLTTCPDVWLPPDWVESTVSDPGRDIWYRTERQTFRKFGRSTVLFGIEVHLWPMGEALGPASAAGLANEIRTMPPALWDYKELLASHHELLLGWLDERAALSG